MIWYIGWVLAAILTTVCMLSDRDGKESCPDGQKRKEPDYD